MKDRHKEYAWTDRRTNQQADEWRNERQTEE